MIPFSTSGFVAGVRSLRPVQPEAGIEPTITDPADGAGPPASVPGVDFVNIRFGRKVSG
jgi:hypothetical protein